MCAGVSACVRSHSSAMFLPLGAKAKCGAKRILDLHLCAHGEDLHRVVEVLWAGPSDNLLGHQVLAA